MQDGGGEAEAALAALQCFATGRAPRPHAVNGGTIRFRFIEAPAGMPRLRAISRFCLLLTLIAAACGGPPAASPTVPSPTPLAAATLTLSPVSPPIPSTTVPTATQEVTTNQQIPLPSL